MAADAVLSVKLRSLNDVLVCALCNGYFRDAHTITECIHTFCKECLQTHFGKQRVEAYQRKARGRRSGQGASQAQAQLQAQAQAQAQAQSQVAANGAARERDAAGDGDNESSSDESSSARRPNLCPQCGEDLGGDPWKTSIRPDRLLQSVVDQLLRAPLVDETASSRPIERVPSADQLVIPVLKKRRLDAGGAPTNSMQQFDFVVELRPAPGPNRLRELPRPFAQLLRKLTVNVLRKLVAAQLRVPPASLELVCANDPLALEHTLEFLAKTVWREERTLCIHYRARQ